MSGTSHNSPKSGHGPKVRRTRYAVPTTGLPRNAMTQAEKRGRAGKHARWLKIWGSRPEAKPALVVERAA